MDTRTSVARHWIAGEWRQSDDMAEAESIDPATGERSGVSRRAAIRPKRQKQFLTI